MSEQLSLEDITNKDIDSAIDSMIADENDISEENKMSPAEKQVKMAKIQNLIEKGVSPQGIADNYFIPENLVEEYLATAEKKENNPTESGLNDLIEIAENQVAIAEMNSRDKKTYESAINSIEKAEEYLGKLTGHFNQEHTARIINEKKKIFSELRKRLEYRRLSEKIQSVEMAINNIDSSDSKTYARALKALSEANREYSDRLELKVASDKKERNAVNEEMEIFKLRLNALTKDLDQHKATLSTSR